MNQHTIKRFEDELTELKEKVLAMGGLVEKATKRSMNSLIKQDSKRAHKVIDRDHAINTLEVEIDDMTRTILALRQPAAGDLRFIMTTIKVVTDLERMGDLAENIAENMLKTEEHPLTQISSLQSFSDLVLDQLTQALNAFSKGDLDDAMVCIEENQKVQQNFKSMQREYLTYMMEDPRQITAGLIATDIARSLERIGDHAVNVAEMVIYMVKGKEVRHVDTDTATALINE
ncbi:phosphate transport system regulatory protein PhoU [Mariprofundus sp. EBB-1]|uniref:phosphate signaling complex protein PhoU n=1 Tax=Mariprofundus sp. EBB-1 TaxID=2650971 RepID=UPI000EF1FAF8|nr:phosphate signaling complex protein PhoU [Mariprofundus sp. EBB-1]RLL55524.1 phosphate transport system regulatory protein PhoU [Mariprofundus sp. EBB-1]